MIGLVAIMVGFGAVWLMLALQVDSLKFKNKILEDRIKALEESVFKLITMDFDEDE